MSRLLGVLLALSVSLVIASAACGGNAAPPDDRSPSDAPPATATSGRLTYIALGDSLSAGFGASNASETAFVPLVRESLGDNHDLMNLGHGGDTSADLIDHGHLKEAIDAIAEGNGDEVALVTLEIGGNDLLRLYVGVVLTGICPDATTALNKPECTEPLAEALAEFDTILGQTLDQLLDADPSLRILLLTLYNPLPEFLPARSVAALSLEGLADSQFPEGLNDIIRNHANQRDIPIVELYEPFEDRASELISGDFIHPNDAGYRVMADAVIATLQELAGR